MTRRRDEMTRQHDEITRRHVEINLTRGRVDSMNWRDEKRTLRHDYAAGRDEHFVQELTPYINTSDTCALSAVTGIPVISLSRDTRPINECKKSVQMHPGYKTYAHATLDIVNTFQWKKLALLYDGKNLSYGFYFTKELCSCQVNEIALFFGLFVLFVLFLFFALKFASYRQSLSAYRKDIHTDFMLQVGQNNI